MYMLITHECLRNANTAPNHCQVEKAVVPLSTPSFHVFRLEPACSPVYVCRCLDCWCPSFVDLSQAFSVTSVSLLSIRSAIFVKGPLNGKSLQLVRFTLTGKENQAEPSRSLCSRVKGLFL